MHIRCAATAGSVRKAAITPHAAHLTGMTATLAHPLDLPIQAGDTALAALHAAPVPARPLTVADYDEAMRQRCADDRDLVTRSGFAAPCPMPRHLVSTTPDGRVNVTDLSEDPAAATPMPARTIIDLLEARDPAPDKSGRPRTTSTGEPATQPRPVMFADDATVHRVIAGFRKAADRGEDARARYIGAANRLTLVASMRFSVLRPVLTRMLAHRFWIGRRYDQRHWQEWAAAWSGTARIARSAGQVELLHTLAGLAFQHGGTKLVPVALASTLARAEAAVWTRGASSKATSTHGAYRSVTDFESAWNECILTDPLLRDRNALAGDIAVGKITQTAGKVKVLLANTPRFNDTSLWLSFDGRRYRATREALLAGDDNTLTLVVTVADKWTRAVTEARAASTPVTLYPQRFDMPTALPKDDNAWLNPPAQPWARRPVPADVLLAGAPAV